MAGWLEQTGRHLLTAVMARLIPAAGDDPYRLSDASPARVLFVRHDDRIGNLVLLTPLLQAAHQCWPEAEIAVLTGPRYRALLEGLPELDRIWVLQKRRILRNPLRLIRLMRALRRHHYAVAFDASPLHSLSLTGAALTYLSGAPVRVAYQRGEAASFANLLVEPLTAQHHESAILLNLLRPFTDAIPGPPMRLMPTPAEREQARERFERAGVAAGEVVVGVHVGGRGVKRWPLERWIGLLKTIQQHYRVRPVIFCGPGEGDQAGRLRDALKGEVLIFDSLDVRALAAQIACCTLFMSPDTGPMHMAVALGVPTVAVFLEDTWRRYGPLGTQHRIVRAQAQGGEQEMLLAFAEMIRERFPEDAAP